MYDNSITLLAMSQGLSNTYNRKDALNTSYDNKDKNTVFSSSAIKEALRKAYGHTKPMVLKTKCATKIKNNYRSDHNINHATNLLKLSNNLAAAQSRQKSTNGTKELKYGS